MTTLDIAVADHYTSDDLLGRIREALDAAGVDPDAPRPEDLKPVDEFHTAGLEATEALIGKLGIGPDTKVIDIGCGIGGTVRYLVHRYGCPAGGVDLTPAFVETAIALSRMTGLNPRCGFKQGSVLDLPLHDGGFDVATMFHVGMNVEDKARLFAEVYRVLVPGGTFALFDIMKRSDAPLDFPVPWASHPSQSFVDPPEAYRAAAAAAGFVPVAERDCAEDAVAFFDRVVAHVAQHGTSPIGLHLLMGPTARQKYDNAIAAAKSGRTGPFEMIFRKPD